MNSDREHCEHAQAWFCGPLIGPMQRVHHDKQVLMMALPAFLDPQEETAKLLSIGEWGEQKSTACTPLHAPSSIMRLYCSC